MNSLFAILNDTECFNVGVETNEHTLETKLSHVLCSIERAISSLPRPNSVTNVTIIKGLLKIMNEMNKVLSKLQDRLTMVLGIFCLDFGKKKNENELVMGRLTNIKLASQIMHAIKPALSKYSNSYFMTESQMTETMPLNIRESPMSNIDSKAKGRLLDLIDEINNLNITLMNSKPLIGIKLSF